ncbi:hypothetical protein ACFXGA_06160 [Actinosynnema sp. NPDC059335]|uniref:hypothetical protein n=1 Tax=Actinosynnema sp. NPDC059335 TaxID=3346804 RepID=UPI00366A6008
MYESRLLCPVDECEWFLSIPFDQYVPRLPKTEKQIEAHVSKHPAEDFLRTIARQRAELTAAREQARREQDAKCESEFAANITSGGFTPLTCRLGRGHEGKHVDANQFRRDEWTDQEAEESFKQV